MHMKRTKIGIGILLLLCVSFLAARSDMTAAQKQLSETVDNIKEQCNGYERLSLASETKSLMRIIESSHQIDHLLSEIQEKNGQITEEDLQNSALQSYVTGALILSPSGEIKYRYFSDAVTEEVLADTLTSDTLLSTAVYPEKSYSVRLQCADESTIDLAAIGRENGDIIVSFYHTSEEYINAFNLSLESLLSGYDSKQNGTIVVASGTSIIASNNRDLIGKSTDDIAILKQIRKNGHENRLTHAGNDSSAVSHDFGLMKRGRIYYVFAYIPEREVFHTTARNVFLALIIYLLILALIDTVHRKTAQRYREDQLKIQQEYNDRLQIKNEQLEQAVQAADRANLAKTNFLSRMSHDIRTPLNGIIGLLEIDESHPDDLTLIRTNQKKMRVAANHLLSLINDVLQMSKLESGEIVLAHEPMNLNELSKEVLTIVEQRAAEAGVTLEYDKGATRIAHANVYGSPLHIRQIFLNIYGNCIKYNRVGGKVTTVCTCLGMQEHTVTYEWVISDTGVGMSEEFLAHIFDPFVQEQYDARSVYNGTGLGMSIVKSLIDEMKGTISISSTKGEGSVFTIRLPFELAEETVVKEAAPTKETPKKESIKGLHLLLAEDNTLNAEIAQKLLCDRGAEITIARDGQQAIDLFQNNPPGTFDAILMDVMMPVKDGMTATKEIRAMDREDAKTIPVIAMTANAFEEDARKCLRAGMNAHLPKPLQIKKVVSTILQYCS